MRYEPVDSPDHTTIFPYHELEPPTVADVYRARRRIRPHLPRTPLVRSEWLSEELAGDVYLKREDTLPTGAFKVRGGINLTAQLDPSFRDVGLVAASTGNHGQSVAYAARAFGVDAVVCVPEDANPEKVRAMERYGADVVHHGADYDEAREHAERLAIERGYRYVHSANEPDLIAGVGTAGLEIVEERPDVDALVCPIGGGSSAAGYALTVGHLVDAAVIGVQSARAPAMQTAWREDSLEPHDRMETFAEGLASRVPFALTTEILRDRLADFRLVEDDHIERAMQHLLAEERLVVEGAGAAATAGALEHRDHIPGETIVVVVSGRNVSAKTLERTIHR